MKRFYIVLSCCFLVLLMCCGCSLRNASVDTSETTNQKADPVYYTLADFADIVWGETTYSEVLELVPPSEHINAFSKVLKRPLSYPTKDNCEITVYFDMRTGVVTKVHFIKPGSINY